MVARIFVSMLFVPRYGFTAICCADQAAWLTADLYLVPMCFYLLRKVERLTLAKTSMQKGENQ
jgi:hypothetical protein